MDVKRAADLYAQGWTLRQIDLARKLHAVGSLNRFEIPRMLSGLSRRISVDQVIAGRGERVAGRQRSQGQPRRRGASAGV